MCGLTSINNHPTTDHAKKGQRENLREKLLEVISGTHERIDCCLDHRGLSFFVSIDGKMLISKHICKNSRLIEQLARYSVELTNTNKFCLLTNSALAFTLMTLTTCVAPVRVCDSDGNQNRIS